MKFKITAKIKFKTNSDIKSFLNSGIYSSWSSVELEKYENDLIKTNEILCEIIDKEKYELQSLQELIYEFDTSTQVVKYEITEELLKHSDRLPKQIVEGLKSEWASETIEPIYPKVNFEIVED